MNFNLLSDKLSRLSDRQRSLRARARELKLEMKDFDVLFRDEDGINVIARFKNDVEKKRIIGFCQARDLSYTECPRYIRVLDDAISIELKRL
jgi:hypothetical protein